VNATKRTAIAQLVFCQGCCCGRVDRGKPELPVELLKDTWKAEKLNAAVQLTISGCLGPCDRTNVTLVMTPAGNRWLGDLEGEATYAALIGWARACKAAGALQPLPESLASQEFERFPA
jgi:hypothetical protein